MTDEKSLIVDNFWTKSSKSLNAVFKFVTITTPFNVKVEDELGAKEVGVDPEEGISGAPGGIPGAPGGIEGVPGVKATADVD